MTDYRLYCIQDDHFSSCEEFFAEDDEAAITESSKLRREMAAELWSRARQVHTFEVASASVTALQGLLHFDLRQILTMATATVAHS